MFTAKEIIGSNTMSVIEPSGSLRKSFFWYPDKEDKKRQMEEGEEVVIPGRKRRKHQLPGFTAKPVDYVQEASAAAQTFTVPVDVVDAESCLRLVGTCKAWSSLKKESAEMSEARLAEESKYRRLNSDVIRDASS